MKKTSIHSYLKYNDSGTAPNVSLIMRTYLGKMIRIAFRKGQFISEHYSKSPIIIEVHEGKIEFGAEGRIHTLEKGDIISLEGEMRHDLTALEDSIVKLTLHDEENYGRIRDILRSQEK